MLRNIAAMNSLNLSFGQELKSSHSNKSFLFLNKMWKKWKKLTVKKYVIVCALAEIEDHIN